MANIKKEYIAVLPSCTRLPNAFCTTIVPPSPNNIKINMIIVFNEVFFFLSFSSFLPPCETIKYIATINTHKPNHCHTFIFCPSIKKFPNKQGMNNAPAWNI